MEVTKPRGVFILPRPRERCICEKENCNLRTHKAWREARRTGGSHRQTRIQQSAKGLDQHFIGSYAYIHYDPLYSSISSSSIDPFRRLPLPEKIQGIKSDAVLRFYFTVEAGRTFAVPRPTQLTSDVVMSPFFASAMQDTSLCLSILACSSAIMGIYSAKKAQTPSTLQYAVIAMRELRKQLEKQLEVTEMQIVAMLFLCGLSIYCEDRTGLRQHYRGIQESVRRLGGIGRLKFNGATSFIRFVELYCCLIFSEAPKFPCPDPPKDLQQQIPQIYGSAWTDLPGIDTQVLENCRKTSFMTDILSHVHKHGSSMPCYLYLVQMAVHLSHRRATLIARLRKSSTISTVILQAVQILVFLIFYGSEKHALIFKIYSRAIVSDDNGIPHRFSEYDLNLRIWLLATSCLAPVEFEQKHEAQRRLMVELTSKFSDENWPEDWPDQLEQVLVEYLWCKGPMSRHLSTLCSNIRHSRSSTDASITGQSSSEQRTPKQL